MKRATYKFLPSQGNEDNRLTVVLGGDLTINTVAEFVENMKIPMAEYDNFYLKLTGVDAVDLAFLQVIHSFCFSAREMGKKVKITASLNAEIVLLLKNSGVFNILVSETNER